LLAVALSAVTPPAAAQSHGRLTGFVYDARSGSVLAQAQVEIVGSTAVARTSVDGDYELSLPGGEYSVRYSATDFIPQTVEKVIVTSGKTTTQDVVLVPVGFGESIDIVSGDDAISALEDRRAATTISDTLSKQELAADPASDAAGVLARVPGITVVDDYVFVRGLGERYSNTVMNDAILPTTEPDRRVVPMDLIPTALLQSVKVYKTFTPDQPGEFSGGLVQLETVEKPSNASLSGSFAIGFNSQTQGEPFWGYRGDSYDWLGFGISGRRLPATIPRYERAVRGNPFLPGGFTPDELQVMGRSFKNIWSPQPDHAQPNLSGNVSGGGTWGWFGFVGAIGLKNGRHSQLEQRNYYQIDLYGLTPQSTYAYQNQESWARLGAAANATFELSDNHRIYWKNFLSNQATDEVRIFEGPNTDRGKVLRNSRLRYTVERIVTSQLAGSHVLPLLGNAILNWRYTYSRASLDEPDLREVLYEQNDLTGEFEYLDQTQSLFRMFNEMAENVREPGMDLTRTWMFDKASLTAKLGGSYSNRDRVFDSRRFRFTPRSVYSLDPTQPPEVLLAPENINPDTGFELREETRNTDHYDALQNIAAGYAMADLNAGKWRFIGGVRYERSIQRVNTFEPFEPSVPTVGANLDDSDWLPSLGIAYNLTAEMALRAGLSRTVSRPQFRELSPFEFTDVTGGRSVVGNPDLLRTTIDNYDLRWEWYFATGELLAVSGFYKRLNDPIETVIEPGANIRASYRNAQAARNAGLEVEMRQNLGRLWSSLDTVTVHFNYTFVNSKVSIGELENSILTSTERPLMGQSQNVLNAVLVHVVPSWDFESRVIFNYTGERISDVGSLGLPDVIEQGFAGLDVRFAKRFGGERKPWSVEFEIENVLDRVHDTRQGGLGYQTYRSGRDFTTGVSYTFF
jgi:outer membrane receptor protein involved in Fe transport